MRLNYFTDQFVESSIATGDSASPDAASTMYSDQPPIYLQTFCVQANRAADQAAIYPFRQSTQWPVFQTQTQVVVTHIRDWCASNIAELSANDLQQWDIFLAGFLNPDMMHENAATIGYGEGKKALESIWLALSAPGLNQQQASDALKNAMQSGELTVCDEGTVTNLLNLGRTIQQNPRQAFKSFILQTIDQLAIEAINDLRSIFRGIGSAYETHVAVLFSNPLCALLGFPERHDAYTEGWLNSRSTSEQLRIVQKQSEMDRHFRQHYSLLSWLSLYAEKKLLPMLREYCNEHTRVVFDRHMNGLGEDDKSPLLFDAESGELLDDALLPLKLQLTLTKRLFQSGCLRESFYPIEGSKEVSFTVREYDRKAKAFIEKEKTRQEVTSLFYMRSALFDSPVLLPDRSILMAKDFFFGEGFDLSWEDNQLPLWTQMMAADIEYTQQELMPFMIAAVKNNSNIAFVRGLINKGASPDITSHQDGDKHLMSYITENSRWDVMLVMLQGTSGSGVLSNSFWAHAKEALWKAYDEKQLAVVEEIIAHLPKNLCHDAFLLADKEGKAEVIDMLLKCGVPDYRQVNRLSNLVKSYSGSAGERREIYELRQYAGVMHQDRYPILLAYKQNNLDLVVILLDQQAINSYADSDYVDNLSLLAYKSHIAGHFWLADRLKQAGAPVPTKSEALCLEITCGSQAGVQHLLADNDFNPVLPTASGVYPLEAAAKRGDFATLTRILHCARGPFDKLAEGKLLAAFRQCMTSPQLTKEKNLAIYRHLHNQQLRKGFDLIKDAAETGNWAVVESILHHTSTANINEEHKAVLSSVLFLAAKENQSQIVHLLVQRGICSRDTEVENGVTKDVLNYAISHNNADMIKDLLASGMTLHEGEQARLRRSSPLESASLEIKWLLAYDAIVNRDWSHFVRFARGNKVEAFTGDLGFSYFKAMKAQDIFGHTIPLEIKRNFMREVKRDRAPVRRVVKLILFNLLAFLLVPVLGLGVFIFISAKLRSGSAGIFCKTSSAGRLFRMERGLNRNARPLLREIRND